MNIFDRLRKRVLGREFDKLAEAMAIMNQGYYDGPWRLPPNELARELAEVDSQLLYDLLQQAGWEVVSAAGYDLGDTAERERSVKEATRLWKYSPVAQQIVTTWTSFGVGESVEIKATDPEADEVWSEFWSSDRNSWLSSHQGMRSFSNWLVVTGNRFLAVYASETDGEAYVRRLKTSEIVEIVTHPDDDGITLFYKRVWLGASGSAQTWYYPDWWAFFYAGLDDEYKDGQTLAEYALPTDAIRADRLNSDDETGTVVCVVNTKFGEWDDGSHWGRSLLAPAGAPWIRAHKQYLESRLATAKSKMLYARDLTVKGGSRAVDAVRRTLQSSLATSGYLETNPPPVPGAEFVHNQALTMQDLPIRTGASDAHIDHEQFAWIAGLSGGLFKYFLGLESTRLATAKAMDKTQLMRFSEYRKLLTDAFGTLVRIVLLFHELYSTEARDGELGTAFESYEAEVSIDSLVEADVESLTTSAVSLVKDIIMPGIDYNLIPDETAQAIIAFLVRTVLTGFMPGVASQLTDDQAFGIDTQQETDDEPSTMSEAHDGQEISYPCPLPGCGGLTAILYPGHKGLLVCAKCEMTFDPVMEGEGETHDTT